MPRTEAGIPESDPPPPPHRHNPFDVTWHERVVVLGTVFGALLAALVLGLIFAREETVELLGLVPASFFFVGKFLPLRALVEGSHFTAYQLGLVIGIMDTCTVLIIVYSLEALYRWPAVARVLARANTTARLVLHAYPWMRRFAITAIVIFVLFPVAGTGAVGGSFLGALLGLHRVRLIAAVSGGGFLGGMTMAFLSLRFGDAIEQLNNNPVIIALLAATIAGLLYAMNRAYKKALARAEEAGTTPADILAARRRKDTGGTP